MTTFGELAACHWPPPGYGCGGPLVRDGYPVHWSLSRVRKLIRDQRCQRHALDWDPPTFTSRRPDGPIPRDFRKAGSRTLHSCWSVGHPVGNRGKPSEKGLRCLRTLPTSCGSSLPLPAPTRVVLQPPTWRSRSVNMGAFRTSLRIVCGRPV